MVKVGAAALVCLALYYAVSAISARIEQSEKERAESLAPKQMPISWCVDVCQEDIFTDMHSSGDSWGTSSSSMSGMAQSDTFAVVIKHCTEIYTDGCIKIESYYDDYLHKNNSGKKAMVGEI